MRIARVLTRLNLGGPARQVLASDPRLGSRGHTVRIFAGTPEPGEGDLFGRARACGLDVVRVPGLARGWSLARDLRARRFLRAALLQFAPDVVHTHASKAGALGRSAARALPGVARVHTFHGHVLESHFSAAVSRGISAVERKLARDTDRVIAVSHATADDLLRLGIVAEKRLVIVPPGVELEAQLAIEGRSGELRRRVGAGDDVRLVGVIGRLAQVKRPEWAVEVFATLAARYPALQLVFIGDGDQRSLLEQRIAELPDAQRERVHLVGALEDMVPALADLDAVLATSRAEGLPVALIEASAAALPIVATRAGGTAELVANERSGLLGDTVDELAHGLARLLDDRGLGRTLGRRARLRAAHRHGAETLTDRLEGLYRTLCEERQCAC